MSPLSDAIWALAREALILSLVLSAPTLVAALGIGLVTGILQAATQVQEQSLGTVPRLFVAIGVTALGAPWIAARAGRFATACLALAAEASR